jgi:Concanavalin A-like lectin/glucanases superfamily/Periplasmic copper-binding protein (NosD)
MKHALKMVLFGMMALLIIPLAHADITTDLQGYYRFEQNLLDSSGHGNNGTAINSISYPAGYHIYGMHTDNAWSAVDIGNDVSLQITGNLTLSLWVYPIDDSCRTFLISKAPSDYGEYTLFFSSSACDSYIGLFRNSYLAPVAGFPPQYGWTLLTVATNETETRIYFNESLMYSGAGIIADAPTIQNVLIGNLASEIAYGHDVIYDDVRIYNRTLTEADITELFNFVPPTSENVYDCGNLSFAGTTYNLMNNVTASGSCFLINANNITLDCHGKTIRYAINQSGSGITADTVQYPIIKNCNVVKDSNEFTDNIGINLTSAYYGSIENNNIISTDGARSHGLIAAISEYNEIEDNTIFTSSESSVGIILTYTANNNIITNNVVHTESWYGGEALLLYYSAEGNNISNNILESTQDYAISIQEFSSGFIFNNLINGSTTPIQIIDSSAIFNTTKQSGSKIYPSGSVIGGNFYADSSGSGYSETCADVDLNGFCDVAYDVVLDDECDGCSSNSDFLPYSTFYSTTPPIETIEINGTIGENEKISYSVCLSSQILKNAYLSRSGNQTYERNQIIFCDNGCFQTGSSTAECKISDFSTTIIGIVVVILLILTIILLKKYI